MDDTNVWVVGFGSDKTSKAVTSCDAKDARHYADYYRRIGYSARILSAEKLEELLERESNECLMYCME